VADRVRAPLPPLIDLEAFEAAARHGSFVGAAAELHLTPSAVSHRVKALERHLGVPLFTRLARRIELTDHGRAYMPTVRKAFDELAVATTGMFGWGRPDRRLTVRVPISYAVNCVAPRLHEFHAHHPGIEVRMVSAIWADAIATHDIDVDIRYGAGPWPGHRAELLHAEQATAIWTADFEARHGRVRGAADLAARPRVHVLGLEDPWAGVASDAAVVAVDTSLAAMEMAQSGEFSTVVLHRFAERALAAGRFRTAIWATAPIAEAHWVVTPLDRTEVTAEALLFIEWLRSNATAAASPRG
jgi:LysR family glycine cleavage system transcriptional activator